MDQRPDGVVRGKSVRRGRQDVARDDTEIVSVLRAALADKVGKERFELWFGAGTRLRLHGDTLTVGVPNRFFQDWLRLNFRRHIEDACQQTLGRRPALVFSIDATLPEPPLGKTSPGGSKTLSTNTGRSTSTPHAQPARQESSATERSNGVRRRRFADLESFVTGDSNRMAWTSAQMAARQPGQISPLLIHGPTSVGKTHLLEGIWTSVRRARRGTTVIYLSAEQFTTYYLSALRGSGLPSFRTKYRGVGLLIIDDLQFFCGKRATVTELLYTVDTFLREGRQLVFAADRSPAGLAELGPELMARLESGMVCGIDLPDRATRLGIVAQMARRMSLRVPADVKEFIASRLTGHARELSGALCQLQAAAEALGKPITLAMAEEALAEMIRHSGRVVRLGDIQQAVCEVFGLEPSTLQSSRRAKCVSYPRMLAMWLARKHTRAALSEIGQFFGRRSHSTVISAQKRVDRWLADGKPVDLVDHTWQVDDAIRRVERQLQAG